MPPLARITGSGPATTVAVSETSDGYKAEVTPPTYMTARELKDMLYDAGDGSKTRSTLLTRTCSLRQDHLRGSSEVRHATTTPPPPPLPPGATTEMVSAKEVTWLKAVGTVEEYEAKAESVKESLRWELYCFLPTCTLTDTVDKRRGQQRCDPHCGRNGYRCGRNGYRLEAKSKRRQYSGRQKPSTR